MSDTSPALRLIGQETETMFIATLPPIWTVPHLLDGTSECWETLVHVGALLRHPSQTASEHEQFLRRAVLKAWARLSAPAVESAWGDAVRAIGAYRERLNDAVQEGIGASSPDGWFLREERERVECALQALRFLGMPKDKLPGVEDLDELGLKYLSVTEPDMEAPDILWEVACTYVTDWWGACGPVDLEALAALEDEDVV